MFSKIRDIFFLISFFTFVLLITRYYFSEENVISTNKSRSSYAFLSSINKNNLPVLKNDTKNIIAYINGLENFKNKKKKRIWETLIFDTNE